MATEFIPLDQYLAEELKKYAGVLVPVKAGMFEKLFVRKVGLRRLHPNPDDEFCISKVGPSYRIITEYEQRFRREGSMELATGDRIIVQKVRPDGYMILNGHHRWAAAMRVGLRRVPISITNITQETDIEEMLRLSKHDRRVTLDLDEVVFCTGDNIPAEKPLRFPFCKMYKEKIRLGVPALLHLLSMKGYDIWVYSANYYSFDYIRAFFKKFSVKVDGVITGTSGRDKRRGEMIKRTEKLFSEKYRETILIDRSVVLRSFREPGRFEEYTIEADPAGWSQEVMNLIKGLKQDGE